ncbi:hypothetical protein Esti_003094 [Eimeria stiedai]
MDEAKFKRRYLDPEDTSAEQVFVAAGINKEETEAGQSAELQHCLKPTVPTVPAEQHDKPTPYRITIGGSHWLKAHRDFGNICIRVYSRTYVESCTRCQASRNLSSKLKGLLQSLQIRSRRWQNVSLDLIVALPHTQRGHDAILTMVDTVSKMAHFTPTTTNATTAEVAFILADRLVRYHGLPKVLTSDRDPRFVAELWKEFCERFDIQKAMWSAWHPQTDGQTERVHRTLVQVLRTYIQSDETPWEDLLPAVELAHACTTRSSTGPSPFKAMIGENPLRASDLDVVENFEPSVSPTMTKIFQPPVHRAPKYPTGTSTAEVL